MLAAMMLAMVAQPASDGVLACAAARYRAAGVAGRGLSPAELTAAKGMGAIMPVGRGRQEARRLRQEGDALRAEAGTTLSRAEIVARFGDRGCAAG